MFTSCYLLVTVAVRMLYLVLVLISVYWIVDWIIRIPSLSKESIRKKYVLITGCDSGFGREGAVMLDKIGLNVFATCMTREGEEYLQVRKQ